MYQICLKRANSSSIVLDIFFVYLTIADMLKENDIHFRLHLVYKICIFGLIFVCYDTFLARSPIDEMINGTYS